MSHIPPPSEGEDLSPNFKDPIPYHPPDSKYASLAPHPDAAATTPGLFLNPSSQPTDYNAWSQGGAPPHSGEDVALQGQDEMHLHQAVGTQSSGYAMERRCQRNI